MTRGSTSRAQGLTWDLTGARCKDLALWWTALEHEHRNASDAATARGSAEQVLAVCLPCPVSEPCAERARLDRYTGFAAGSLYVNGRQRRLGTLESRTQSGTGSPA